MALSLHIITKPNDVLLENILTVFSEEGGSIGRAEHCDLSLPDDTHTVSKIHALIHFRDNMYFITDVSTNGVFVNAESIPIGKGNTKQMLEGEKLRIGDYVIQASFNQAGAVLNVANDDMLFTSSTQPNDAVDEIEALLNSNDDISELLDVEVSQQQVSQASIVTGDELSIDSVLANLDGDSNSEILGVDSMTSNDDAIADLLGSAMTSTVSEATIDVMATAHLSLTDEAIFNAVLAEMDNYAMSDTDSATTVALLKQHLLQQKTQIMGSS